MQETIDASQQSKVSALFHTMFSFLSKKASRQQKEVSLFQSAEQQETETTVFIDDVAVYRCLSVLKCKGVRCALTCSRLCGL
jgi:hypothetical protein